MPKEKCSNCGWWRPETKKEPGNGEPQGRCKAGAPQITAVVMPVVNRISREVTPQIIEVTCWPLTIGETEACGSYISQFKAAAALDRNGG